MPASLRQLRAYVLLLQERNFTRAAASMHLSQPAFSALIGALESTLGVRLFDRSTRHVAPTVEGADFESAARRVLAEFDNAIAGMHDRATRRRGRVSLALLPSLAAGWLPRRAGAIPRRCIPASAVDVADVLSEACIERVMTGRPTSRSPRCAPRRPSCRRRCSAPTTSTWCAVPTIRWRQRGRRAAWATSPPGPSSISRGPAACASTSMPPSGRRRWTR